MADDTVVVNKRSRTRTPSASAKTTTRRVVAPPGTPTDLVQQAVIAAGADATERYRPRPVPDQPSRPPTVTAALTAAPTAARVSSVTMPSVARRTRLTARTAVAVFAVACLVSVAGLTLIAFTVLARR